mmetsp:Transcript_80652/g.184823  ORF Transcript_80652/g.184823 Transcript_80652/m.184823 type:complete len:243 (-) Transcript_80652:29-757(-)
MTESHHQMGRSRLHWAKPPRSPRRQRSLHCCPFLPAGSQTGPCSTVVASSWPCSLPQTVRNSAKEVGEPPYWIRLGLQFRPVHWWCAEGFSGRCRVAQILEHDEGDHSRHRIHHRSHPQHHFREQSQLLASVRPMSHQQGHHKAGVHHTGADRQTGIPEHEGQAEPQSSTPSKHKECVLDPSPHIMQGKSSCCNQHVGPYRHLQVWSQLDTQFCGDRLKPTRKHHDSSRVPGSFAESVGVLG